jgi:hypothetical protein
VVLPVCRPAPQDHPGPCYTEIADVSLSAHMQATLELLESAAHLARSLTCATVLLSHHVQAALKAFDDDHNGSLDHDEFERFAKSLMKSGELGERQQLGGGGGQQLGLQQHNSDNMQLSALSRQLQCQPWVLSCRQLWLNGLSYFKQAVCGKASCVFSCL